MGKEIKYFKNNAKEKSSNERYDLYYLEGEKLKIGLTVLNPKMQTRGHSHEGVEEVYHFISGSGTMVINDKLLYVSAGDIVFINSGEFHKVSNNENEALVFFVAFNK